MGKNKSKGLTKVGRKSIYTPDLVTKLESVLKIGGTIEEATSYARISRETYYRWLEEKPKFMTKMAQAQHYADIVAKNVVVDSMIKDRNLETAKWWLEKRQFKTDGNTFNLQQNFIKQEATIDMREVKEFIKWRDGKRRKEIENAD